MGELENRAREQIDRLLAVDITQAKIHATRGVANREFPLIGGHIPAFRQPETLADLLNVGRVKRSGPDNQVYWERSPALLFCLRTANSRKRVHKVHYAIDCCVGECAGIKAHSAIIGGISDV